MTFVVTPDISFRHRFFDSPDVVLVAGRRTGARDELHRQRAPLETSSPRRLESTHAVDEPHARLFGITRFLYTPPPAGTFARHVAFASSPVAGNRLLCPSSKMVSPRAFTSPNPISSPARTSRSADVYRRPSALRQLDPARATARAAELGRWDRPLVAATARSRCRTRRSPLTASDRRRRARCTRRRPETAPGTARRRPRETRARARRSDATATATTATDAIVARRRR